MGRVYKARDAEVREKIALKLIRPELAADKEAVERFRGELKTARGLAHKHVCRIYDLSHEQGTPFITMEYVEGENLSDMVPIGPEIDVFRDRRACDSRAILPARSGHGAVDIHPFVKGVVFEDIWKNRITSKIGKTEVYFPSLEDMIRMKKAAGRAKDREKLIIPKKLPEMKIEEIRLIFLRIGLSRF